MDSNLVEQLVRLLGKENVLDAAQVAQRSAGIMHGGSQQAGMLVRPRTTAEVAAALRACNEARVAVVPQGGLSGLVRGTDARPQDIALSLERMGDIEDIDVTNRTARVQAGVRLQALQEALEPHGLMFPLDLGARGSAMLGGIASTNAGGNRVIRYGMMRDMTLGVEAVLADGTVVSSLNRLIKNNAGYDLKQLFIGTEGTLGVVTRLVLRLREKPRSGQLALVAVSEFAHLPALLKHVDRGLGGALSAFEVMWQAFYDLVTTEPARARPPLPRGFAYYVLVEALGGDPESDQARFEATLESALEHGLIRDAAIARSQTEMASLWAIRDDVLQTQRFAPVIPFDVSLPLDAMEAYMDQVSRAILGEWPDVRLFPFGHLGDGNLHLVCGLGGRGTDIRQALEEMVYRPLAALGGSVSAEHGIGTEKKAYLHLCRTPEEIALMRRLKAALDPRGILNPGKIFD